MARKDRSALQSDSARDGHPRKIKASQKCGRQSDGTCLFPAAANHYTFCGGAKGPVILPVFKAGDPSLRGVDGGFDSHTLPPNTRKQTL